MRGEFYDAGQYVALPLRMDLVRIENDWKVLLRLEPCVYCGRVKAELPPNRPMTIEHVVPKCEAIRPRGWRNYAPACWSCNNRRGAMPLLHFLVLNQAQGLRWRAGANHLRNRALKAYHRLRRERAAASRVVRPLTFTMGEVCTDSSIYVPTTTDLPAGSATTWA